ncbi:MAG: bifunctional phosphoribosyl-AMP cyclohydrolase/phosphoribosyl-ATP diphosphatase HisIE [Azoarcus sp.]|nr:bifunctional phosphoribosyl-AMP cyclohydrolase/phosphoribosyl-ATP diphosphatase HisIE [Azoarcus sp.]
MSAAPDWLDAIRWDAAGLVPVIAQEAASGKVLMFAWMNREALARTVATGEAVYWSRSRARLWHKGEESGHVQKVRDIRLDCDSDALLLSIEQTGGIACHTGRQSCFFRRYAGGEWQDAEPVLKDPEDIYGNKAGQTMHATTNATTNATPGTANGTDDDILDRLSATLAARRGADPESSYTAKLFAGGPDAILKKIGEEAAELIMASKDGQKPGIVYEAADVLFHTLALLVFHGLSIDDVRRELARREGVSGIEEKKARPPK